MWRNLIRIVDYHSLEAKKNYFEIGFCKSKINFCDPNASKIIKNSFSSGDSLTLSSRRYTKLSCKKNLFLKFYSTKMKD